MAGFVHYDASAIRQACGENGAVYAANKQRGGRAGENGWRFEVLYAAYRITLQMHAECEAGGTGSDILFQPQTGGFVDDLAVVRGRKITLSQAKSGQVSWGGGDHPLAEDFRLQAKLDASLGRSSSYELVVSTPSTGSSILASRPRDLEHVEVTTFRANGPDVLALLAHHAELAVALDGISLRKPAAIVREQTFQAVLGAWVHSPGGVCLADLIGQLASRPDALVRVPGPDYVLPEPVVECLLRVANFSWRVVGRHFEYTVRGGLSGWAAELCGTQGFARFERYLLDTQPTTWVAIVRELRREA
jgi:hypothetical protein